MDLADEYRLDLRALRRRFNDAAPTYDSAAVLQSRVRAELIARLDLVRVAPATVLDLGAATGHGALELKRRYRRSRVIALDLAEQMLRAATTRRRLFRRFDRVCGDAAALPLRHASVDLVFSNLMLHWCNEPDAVIRECRRVLRPGGILSFSTYGPDTLSELRRAWSLADAHTHVSRFIDMHDLGDALLRAGLTDVVMDVERIALTYAEVRDLMQDLKAMGSVNATHRRGRGLTGRSAFARLRRAYEDFRIGERLPATFEVVYGQAWRADETATARTRAREEWSVPVTAIGRRGS